MVLHHLFLAATPPFWDASPLAAALRASPLAGLWSGYEPVIFFFTLSGFVLALPFLRAPVSYVPFAIQRVGRIYGPLLVSVFIAAAAAGAFSHLSPPGLGDWVRHVWTTPLSLREIRNHLLLNDSALNPVLWSLGPEMAISLVFPLLMMLVVRASWRPTLLVAIVVTVAARQLATAEPRLPWVWVLPSVPVFMLGALAAKHRAGLVRAFGRLRGRDRALLLIAAWLLYSFRAWLPPGLPRPNQSVTDWMSAIGSCGFIVAALSHGRLRSLLLNRPLVSLGRISYSVYLYHLVILLSVLHLLTGRAPLAVLWLVTVVVTLLAASVAQRWIEVPSNRLGRELGGRWNVRAGPSPNG